MKKLYLEYFLNVFPDTSPKYKCIIFSYPPCPTPNNKKHTWTYSICVWKEARMRDTPLTMLDNNKAFFLPFLVLMDENINNPMNPPRNMFIIVTTTFLLFTRQYS